MWRSVLEFTDGTRWYGTWRLRREDAERAALAWARGVPGVKAWVEERSGPEPRAQHPVYPEGGLS